MKKLVQPILVIRVSAEKGLVFIKAGKVSFYFSVFLAVMKCF